MKNMRKTTNKLFIASKRFALRAIRYRTRHEKLINMKSMINAARRAAKLAGSCCILIPCEDRIYCMMIWVMGDRCWVLAVTKH